MIIDFDFDDLDPKLHVRRGSDPIIPIINGDPQKWNNDPEIDIDSNANTLPDKVTSNFIPIKFPKPTVFPVLFVEVCSSPMCKSQLLVLFRTNATKKRFTWGYHKPLLTILQGCKGSTPTSFMVLKKLGNCQHNVF